VEGSGYGAQGIPRAMGIRFYYRYLALVCGFGGCGVVAGLVVVWSQQSLSVESGGECRRVDLEEGFVTFDRSWVLLIAWIPVAWAILSGGGLPGIWRWR